MPEAKTSWPRNRSQARGHPTHGILFAELKKYVVAKLGGAAWNEVLDAARMPGKIFLPNETYPDEALVALVGAAAKLTRKAPQAILEDFGEFIAPDLLGMYRAQIDPTWSTLDLIEHTEELIHRQVRIKTPGASPPELHTQRTAPDQLLLTYTSPRKLCGVAKGLAKGIARHYDEKVDVIEAACMLKGAKACEISIVALG